MKTKILLGIVLIILLYCSIVIFLANRDGISIITTTTFYRIIGEINNFTNLSNP